MHGQNHIKIVNVLCKTPSSYRAVNTFHLGYEKQFMLYRAKVAVCSEINTRRINTVWAEYTIFDSKPFHASSYQ